MALNLQPIVALSQQLIVARDLRSVQRMVVNQKDREAIKSRWAVKFNAALDRVDFPRGRKRISALAKKLSVTPEAARKWVRGESIPDQTNIQRICEELKIELHELVVTEIRVTSSFGDDPFAVKLAAMWQDLSEDVKGQIVGFALVSATTRPSAKKGDPDTQEEVGS